MQITCMRKEFAKTCKETKSSGEYHDLHLKSTFDYLNYFWQMFLKTSKKWV